MSRSRIAAGLATAVALGTLGAIPLAGAAAADPSFTPDATTDVVGVGSDTTEYALTYLADGTTVGGVAVPGWNADHATGRLASWNATGASTTITPRSGGTAITRPNGSGAGKATLYNPSNPDINFARSSSSLSAAEVSAGLQQVPFAVDGLKLAVAQSGSHAPAAVSATDMVKIYDGTFDTWNDLPGGTSTEAIVPMIPQSGSGTRSFFVSQLKAANGGVDVVLAGTVQTVQEHDPAPIAANANAIAPFSTGRAKSASGITLLGGFDAKRALYNVVRQADLNAVWFAGLFGEGGFICSTAARPLIEAAGFDQLAVGSDGGVCGQPTQAATTNFATNQRSANQSTTTSLQAGVSKQTVSLTATVAAATGTPEGEVQFYDGAAAVGSPAPLSGGVALLNLSGVAPGTHVYKAVFASSDTGAWPDSTSATKSVTVKAASKTTVTMPSKFRATQQAKAVVKVTTLGAAAKGSVKVMKGTKVLGKQALVAGKTTFTLPRFRPGTFKLVFAYLGNAKTAPSKVTKTVTVTR
jgi:ABC-type phosphate transport system substrate-binding protein